MSLLHTFSFTLSSILTTSSLYLRLVIRRHKESVDSLIVSRVERQIIVTPNFDKNEILHNFEQSPNTLSKKLIVMVKYQDDFLSCIVSNYCNDSSNSCGANEADLYLFFDSSHPRVT